jgi:DNA-binding response OmpR family regulator
MSEVAPLILLAEDDRHIRETTCDLLTLAGFRVHAAPSGRTASAILEKETVDLVITDLLMPDGDGFWLINRIRDEARPRRLPVILLTAHADTTNHAAEARTLADDQMSKPFDPDALLEMVRRWLERPLLELRASAP